MAGVIETQARAIGFRALGIRWDWEGHDFSRAKNSRTYEWLQPLRDAFDSDEFYFSSYSKQVSPRSILTCPKEAIIRSAQANLSG